MVGKGERGKVGGIGGVLAKGRGRREKRRGREVSPLQREKKKQGKLS